MTAQDHDGNFTVADDRSPTRRRWLAPTVLLATLLAVGGGLAAWKIDAFARSAQAAAGQYEPMEAIAAATATSRSHQPTITAIGTVLATRWVTLRNELAGTVSEVRLTSGEVVEAGRVLVQLDVSVEQAELSAQKARATLAQTLLDRSEQASTNRAVSEIEVDRARAERDIALAEIARIEAIIARKTIRAPFRARVGLADVHRGQYLDEGTVLTTLQGIDDVAHVDFAVPQRVAAELRQGDRVTVITAANLPAVEGTIVAVDARIDPDTRNAQVRARIAESAGGPSPGASVRVVVADGPPREAVAVPATALRKGPAGDHVFVIEPDDQGQLRAHARPVAAGALLADEVLVLSGLTVGEQVAASGSFKLREGLLVGILGTDGGAAGASGAAPVDPETEATAPAASPEEVG